METVSPQKYVQLYQIYKAKLSNKNIKKWSRYQVYLYPIVANKIKDFVSSKKRVNILLFNFVVKSRPFRTTKMGNKVELFEPFAPNNLNANNIDNINQINEGNHINDIHEDNLIE